MFTDRAMRLLVQPESWASLRLSLAANGFSAEANPNGNPLYSLVVQKGRSAAAASQ